MKAPPLRETDVQHQIADLIQWGLGGHAVGLHIRNETPEIGQRIEGAKTGVLSGAPDLLFVDAGHAIWIELKRPNWREDKLRGGKLNAHERRQLLVHTRLRRAGCLVEICESYDEVVGVLRWHGVPLTVRDVGLLPPREAAAALAARAWEM